ncbi:unnamed protein product [Brassica rapa]|uniref:Uncharacterized protein n=1 Tax=Brassica campestris TaxID=3711 RepID=A0A8D9FZ20_BRACM|nr:unnamed protein product [Brassica rapa]
MDNNERPVCADGHTRTATDVLCMLTDTHGRPVCADGHPRTSCPRTSCVCWRTPTDVPCVLNRQPTWDKITQTVHGKGQRAEYKDQDSPRGPKSPKQSTGRASVQSPRTNGLICTHTDVLCVLTDSHKQPRTSCVCWRTLMDVLCVLNRQPTWDKITQTVHGKGQRAESKDQPTDVLCVLTDTHGQPRTSYVLCVLTDTHGHTRTATDVLCVLADTHGRPVHGRPVCADGHTRTHKDSHGRPVCAGGHPRTSSTDVLCVLADTHGRPVCTEQTAHRADMYTDGQPRTSCTHTDVLCMLTDSHKQPRTQPTWDQITETVHGKGQCAESKDQRADIQRTWAKITQTVHGKGQRAESKDQRADMCTDGQPRTSSTDVMCMLTDTHERPPTWAKITQTVHGKGQRAEVRVLSPRTNVLICLLMDSHGRPVCADGHTRTHKDSHGRPTHMDTHDRPVCADGQPQTATDVLCVLADTHGRPVCTEQTAHSTGRASVLSPRTNVLICVLRDSHGRPVCADGHRRTHTDSQGRPVCAGGHPGTSCIAHVGQNHPNSPREGPACRVQGPTC